jgi:hypothetical protein
MRILEHSHYMQDDDGSIFPPFKGPPDQTLTIIDLD